MRLSRISWEPGSSRLESRPILRPKHCGVPLLVLAAIFFALASVAYPQESPRQKGRPKIGLVLEGGGALGFAHIGVLQWLEDHHIPVDYVAGTSMGGLVGGLYATGKSPQEIKELVGTGINWNEVLNGEIRYPDLSYRRKEDLDAYQNRIEIGMKGGLSLPGGINLGHHAGLVLDRNTLAYSELKSFNDLPIPFRCVAVDLTAGEKKVFDSGALSDALRATMSIPGVFAPAQIGGHYYSDGGVLDNLPVDVAKAMGADIIIAVYLDTGTATKPNQAPSLLTVASLNVDIVIKANELQSMKTADILLTAPLKGYDTMDFTKSAEIVPKGVIAAEDKKAMLERLSVSDAEWQAYLTDRQSRERTVLPVPQFVEVASADANFNVAMQRYLAEFANKPVDSEKLEDKLDRIKGTGRFQDLRYQLIESNGQAGLLVRAHEKSYGPPFLNLAITIDGSDPSDVQFGLSARITQAVGTNPREEWRTDISFGDIYGINTELYRPFSLLGRWFIAPHGYIWRDSVDIYDNGDRVAQYNVTNGGVGLDFGYAVSRFAEFRAGEDFVENAAHRKIGVPDFPSTSVLAGMTRIQFNYLGLDDPIIPRRGLGSRSEFRYYTAGDDGKPYPQLQAHNSYFQPLSQPSSLFLVADGGSAFGHENLGINAFTLGGPFRLGAFGRNELYGNQYYLFQAGYLHQIGSVNPLFGSAIYAGTFFEAGKVWNSIYYHQSTPPLDGSIVLIVKTSLGPAFVGGSLGDNGHAKWWFGLGRVF